jgi:hypothetical protein
MRAVAPLLTDIRMLRIDYGEELQRTAAQEK